MNGNQAEPSTEASHTTDQSSKIGAIDRREYLKYTSVLAGAPVVAGHVSATERNNSVEEYKKDVPAPINLRAEYEQNPTNLSPSTNQSPRLSWQLPATDRGIVQEAYQIRVGTECDSFIDDADAWDSGRVDSSRSTTVEYDGTPLEPDTTYYWTVRIWDTNGNQTPWSDPVHFTTALSDTEEAWEGDWIGMETGGHVSPLLRTNVSINKPIESARAHVVTLGYGELYINGDRIGNEQLNPAKTEYEKRVLYTTYDVESILEQGDNAFGIWLGRGWYAFDEEVGTWGGSDGSPKALLQLNITYSDGTTKSIVTNPSWTMTQSPITRNQIYDGERYDARKDQLGWASTGFNDEDWESADQLAPPSEDLKLQPQRLPPVQITETLEPETIVEREGGYLVDFGQNHTGWVEVMITDADEGDEVTMQHAEVLMTADQELTRDLEVGELNMVDLREADATDVYIAKGDDAETYEPRFTYHGFRYVLISDYPGELTPDDVQSKVVHTGYDQTGSFACSNEDLNQVQDNAVWSLRANAMGYPTDCPQRDERLGWTGDVHLNVHSDFYNFGNANRFHEKWIHDHNDNQELNQEGYVTDTIPLVGSSVRGPADPNWGKTRVIIPWRMYLQTGDESILEDSYEGMRDYVDYWHEQTENNILPEEELTYGDWLAFEGQPEDDERAVQTDPALYNTFAHYQITNIFAKAATALERDDNAQVYRERADAIAEAFHEEFFNPETNNYGTGTQTTYALALFAGIVPDEHEEVVAETLAEKIRTEDDGKLQTGFIGTRPLLFALVEYGYEELAYNIVSQPEQPGWVYMVRQGATTLWERWDSDEKIGSGMNSFNHRPWPLISEWFYQKLGGIDIGEPGFEHVEISPMVVEDLDWAETETETVRGRIVSRWECVGSNGLELGVSIPGNTTATVEIPVLGNSKVRVRESGKTIWNNGNRTRPHHSGIEDMTREDDRVVIEIASGEYMFDLE